MIVTHPRTRSAPQPRQSQGDLLSGELTTSPLNVKTACREECVSGEGRCAKATMPVPSRFRSSSKTRVRSQ